MGYFLRGFLLRQLVKSFWAFVVTRYCSGSIVSLWFGSNNRENGDSVHGAPPINEFKLVAFIIKSLWVSAQQNSWTCKTENSYNFKSFSNYYNHLSLPSPVIDWQVVAIYPGCTLPLTRSSVFLIDWSIDWLMVWSIKCYKIVKKCHHSLRKA